MRPSNAQESEQDSRRANQVWLRLIQIFGQQFVNVNGENVNESWKARLRKLTDDDIRLGLQNLENKGLRFPPNLSQFIAACYETPPVRYLGRPVDIDEHRKMLEAPTASESTAAMHLAAMRERLADAERRPEKRIVKDTSVDVPENLDRRQRWNFAKRDDRLDLSLQNGQRLF